ncbi:MAG: rhodanese-like domain-containing protein [Deinococcales bacterium]
MLRKLVLSALATLTACNSSTAHKNVTVSDLKNANEPNSFILDVRQPEEYAQGHVPRAKLIPLGQLESRLGEIPDNAPIYVICRSGNRSKTASVILAKNGKTDVRNVQGGMLAWQTAGYAVSR